MAVPAVAPARIWWPTWKPVLVMLNVLLPRLIVWVDVLKASGGKRFTVNGVSCAMSAPS
jgi:hypothetical protein